MMIAEAPQSQIFMFNSMFMFTWWCPYSVQGVHFLLKWSGIHVKLKVFKFMFALRCSRSALGLGHVGVEFGVQMTPYRGAALWHVHVELVVQLLRSHSDLWPATTSATATTSSTTSLEPVTSPVTTTSSSTSAEKRCKHNYNDRKKVAKHKVTTSNNSICYVYLLISQTSIYLKKKLHINHKVWLITFIITRLNIYHGPKNKQGMKVKRKLVLVL